MAVVPDNGVLHIRPGIEIMRMLVDMVIPTVNRNEHLAEAPNSAGSMSVPVDLASAPIVIDNTSHDDTRSAVQHLALGSS